MEETLRALEFECVHEVFPVASPELEQVFNYARWLQKDNQLLAAPTVYSKVERLYRIAAEHGHVKANLNLQDGARRGQFSISGREARRYTETLIEAGRASGYYLLGVYLQDGAAGLRQDRELSLRYIRMAADQGNALAQFSVAELLSPIRKARPVAAKLYRCAADQGHSKAALTLAISLKNNKRYDEALRAFQLGVANGSDGAARFLRGAYDGLWPEGSMRYLAQDKDEERAARYQKIARTLSDYSYANPTVPEINEIVPLPPAQLPPWDGKLKWLEDRLANIPPEEPSEALLHELAKAQGLDPATGRPMPGSPAFSKYKFPQAIELSGQACPETGYWKACPCSPYSMLEESVRYFEKGQILPPVELEYIQRRSWPFADQIHHYRRNIQWGLMG